MPKGTIRRLIADRGFGFIKTEQEEDLFFHATEVQGVNFNSLIEGKEVEFEPGRGRDGRPQAVRVRLAETGSSQGEAITGALEDVGSTLGEPQAEEITQGDQD